MIRLLCALLLLASPASAAPLGVFLGATGEDKVSTSPYVFTNGIPDWHLRVSGMKAVPKSLIVRAMDAAGAETFRWVSPGDGKSWAAWIGNPAVGLVDIWVEPHWSPVGFEVVATYADGSRETVSGIKSSGEPPPGQGPPPPATTKPLVIEVGVPRCALDDNPCVTVEIRLKPVAIP